MAKIDNNTYIKDFLSYVLIRDIQRRPTLENIVDRFEHIYAIMTNMSIAKEP